MSLAIAWTSLPRALDLAYAPWHGGLIALFTVDLRGSPTCPQVEALGTGFFLECKGGVAIVTADHVIENLVDAEVGGLYGLLDGRAFRLTRKWVRLPELDLCACWFSQRELAEHGIEPIMAVPFMADRTERKSLGVYAAMGFPNTWNVRNRRRREGGERWFCSVIALLLARRVDTGREMVSSRSVSTATSAFQGSLTRGMVAFRRCRA
jgi:hypothetical protein